MARFRQNKYGTVGSFAKFYRKPDFEFCRTNGGTLMRFRQSRFTDFTHHWIDCIKPFGQVFSCS